MPQFTIHAEARLGTGEDLVTDDILHAGLHAIKHLTFPGVIMTRSCVITDETGLDVTPVLFKLVLDASGSAEDGDLQSIPVEEIELAYRLQMLQYKRVRAQIEALPAKFTPDVTIDLSSESADFEVGLRNFLDSLVPTEDDGDKGETPGQ